MSAPQSDLPVVDHAFLQDPFGRIRPGGPVQQVKSKEGRPVWLVSGYEEVRAVLADPRVSKDVVRAWDLPIASLLPEVEQRGAPPVLHGHMLNVDPPDHTRLRRPLAKAFTPARVEALRPRVEEITAHLLDEMAAQSEVDLLDALAFPLPITVIAELLGVEQTRRDDFRTWSSTVLSDADRKVSRQAGAELSAYLTELVAKKRREPADDLLSDLIEAGSDGERLSEQELVATLLLLLVAGHETTVNLIGNTVLALLANPDQFAALQAEPGLVEQAVEEGLRYDGPLWRATFRFTTEPVEVGGVRIPASEVVWVALGAANREVGHVDRVDTFDITRPPIKHVAFGHGIHFCVGAALARLEGQVAVGRLVERFPELRVACPLDELTWRFSGIIRGLERFPVRTGARLSAGR